MTLELSPVSVAWLACLPGAVDRLDLSRTYSFGHPLNATRALKREYVSEQEQSFAWSIEFATTDGRRVVEPPLARIAFRAKVMYAAGGEGPVALNAYFHIVQEFQGQHFATRVYDSEDQLYRRWGIREIHIQAHDEGLARWIKRFGFLPAEPEELAEDFRTWSRLRGEPAEAPANPADYPAAFLLGRGRLDLYKVLT